MMAEFSARVKSVSSPFLRYAKYPYPFPFWTDLPFNYIIVSETVNVISDFICFTFDFMMGGINQ